MYIESFKNTFAVDILEILGLVQLNEEIPNKKSTIDVTSSAPLDRVESNKSTYSNDRRFQKSKTTDFTYTSIILTNEDSKYINDPYLVLWNGPDDPENPLNWSRSYKYLIIALIMVLTTVTYMGSSIYVPGQETIEAEFGISHVIGTLNLSLYVLGYGIGPMIFSPLSEFAKLGRQQIYIITLFLYIIVNIGCATVHNVSGLIVLRFLAGVFCSPSLATGGGTLADISSEEILPTLLGFYSIGAVVAPYTAPLLGASMVVAKNWRWIFWLLCWLSTVVLLLLIFFFPETHHENILYRRAMRLRKITGDARYYTQTSQLEEKMTIKEFLVFALIKPFKIAVQEPIILAFDLYISLVYGVFYLFFEAFPIVFIGIYQFTLIEVGLSYMGFLVGCFFSFSLFLAFEAKIVQVKFRDGTFVPETYLLLACGVCWAFPAALFMFGWTAGIHWILPILSELLFVLCDFNLFQVTFAYLALCYPRTVASVFAGNGFCRSIFAAAFPLFGTALFNNLGSEKYPVAWGSSLLGVFAIALGSIPFLIYKYGAWLRSKSRYTG